MPESELFRQLGEISGKLDSLIATLTHHVEEDKQTEQRIRQLEISQAKHNTIVAIAGGILGMVGTKLRSMLKV